VIKMIMLITDQDLTPYPDTISSFIVRGEDRNERSHEITNQFVGFDTINFMQYENQFSVKI